MATKPVYPRKGALTKPDDPDYGQAIVEAHSEDDVLTVVVDRKGPVEFPTKAVTIESTTGRLSFVSDDTAYRIRELREDDGGWISRYKMFLPLEALEALITPEGDAVGEESIVAYSSDDSVFVLGVVYTNDSGRWLRTGGDWLLMSPEDNTFDDMIVTEIDPERANEFIDFYDRNHTSNEDAEKYELPDDLES